MRLLMPALPLTLLASLASLLPAQQADAPESEVAPFRVEVHGEGPPVLLIPGLMSGGDVWDDVVERWRGRYELHVFTLAGFAGEPPMNGDRMLERQHDAVIAYISERKLESPVVVGHSLGGFLGFWIASEAPDAIGGLVAVDGVPFLVALGDSTADAATMTTQAESIERMYASLSAEQMALQARMSMSGMMKDTSNVVHAVEWASASDPATVGAAMAEMMTTDLREQVASIRAPVLLIAAAGAAKSDEQRARLLSIYSAQVRRVPNARVVLAEDAYHFVMLDDPEFFHSVVDPFLERVTAARSPDAGAGR